MIHTFKGNPGDEVDLYLGDASCGIMIRAGEIVLAFPEDDTLDACSRFWVLRQHYDVMALAQGMAPFFSKASTDAMHTAFAKRVLGTSDTSVIELSGSRSGMHLIAGQGAVALLKEVSGRIEIIWTAHHGLLDALRTSWSKQVLPGLEDHQRPFAEGWTTAIEGTQIKMRLSTCKLLHDRIDGTLMKAEREKLIFFGELSALKKDEPCWALDVWNGGFNSVIAIFNTSSELQFVWMVPEG